MKLTEWALKNSTFVLAIVVLVMATGLWSLGSHPSREDPAITIRTAVVTASFPGMSSRRVEDLIARQIEEKAREMPEVDTIQSTSRTGQATVRVELHDRYFDLGPIWQSLRNKMDDLKPSLPSGTVGPTVNDTYGEVAMATVALTAEGFSLAEMRESARTIRNKLYTVTGVSKVELFGVEPERIYVEFDNTRLSQLGLSPQSLIDSIGQTNIVSPGGRIEAGIASFAIEPSGNFESLDDLGNVTLDVPNQNGQVVYLRDLVTLTRAYVDPPKNPVFFNAAPAIVLSIQMVDHYDAGRFGADLRAKIRQLENDLPLGYTLSFITFQPDDIATAVSGVMNNLYQTIVIVLVVVMLFLGWRTGLIVGVMVPLTMLLSILVMRYAGIELEKMSLAALIIALGLLVDNGIVVAEEIGRRLALGEERQAAAIATGRALSLPLLSSSLTTILAFMPLMLAENEAGEYTRSLSLVIGIALLGSWVIAMTVTPRLCAWGLKTPKGSAAKPGFDGIFYRGYRRILGALLRFRIAFLVVVVVALLVAVWALKFVPNLFFPASDRAQLQVYVDLPVGTNTYGTLDVARRLSNWLANSGENPDVVSHVAYIASGGPRFYLGLNPIDPDPHRAFLIVNGSSAKALDGISRAIRRFAADRLPEARIQVKPMSTGGSEAGLVEYRILGDDDAVLSKLAFELQEHLRGIQDTVNIKDDWENRVVKILVDVDQARARRASVSSESIASALNATLSGVEVTDYREGDTIIPVYLRALGDERTNIDRLRTLTISKVGDQPIPLLQVADFEGQAEFAMIQRRDLERVVTVSAKHAHFSAAELDALVTPKLASLSLPDGYRIEKGGELESASDAQGALFANMPLAFALIVLILIAQFGSVRKPLIILSVIPFTLIGVTLGLLVMPGAAISFIGILGILALAGIIINNAIVLIDSIDGEREAGASLTDAITAASLKRLRPIIMTTITTTLGLAPLIVGRDILFYDLAVVVSGGLLVGTILTLGVVPVLYSLLFREARVSATP
ncbi:MAG: efflux RND transporter permease subunit [Pseudomonadota bacterium]